MKQVFSDTPPQRVFRGTLRVSFVGHATVLLQTRNLNILTDPIWATRAGPFALFGPKRIQQPGITFESLPPIDIILISHDHFDHLNYSTLKKICERGTPHILCGRGVDARIKRWVRKAQRISSLDWHTTVKITDDISITFMPATHKSGRGFFDKNKTLWGAFVISSPDGPIYFSGDTAYSDHFKQAAKKFGPFRLALLEIGAYVPEILDAHMNAEQAMQAHIDLEASTSIPIHYRTFKPSDEAAKLTNKAFTLLTPGQYATISS